MTSYLTSQQRVCAMRALRERVANTNRIELWYARLTVEDALDLTRDDIDGMTVSKLLRSLGWNKLDPRATGSDIAYGPKRP